MGAKNATHLFFLMPLCIGLFIHAPCAFANDQEPQVTLGEFIVQMPALTSRPLVDYCASEKPELRDDLDGEYKSFIQKLVEAGHPLSVSLSSDPSFKSPVPEEMKDQVERIGEMMLTEVRRVDSNAYCSTILIRMREATVEQLRTQIMQTYDGFRQRALDTQAAESDAP